MPDRVAGGSISAGEGGEAAGVQWGLVAGKRSWIQEERRRTLGDWVALCPTCGHAQRYFEESEREVDLGCPTCGGTIVSRCSGCDARIASVFATECEECGEMLRAPTGFGVRIRRAARPR